MGLPRRVKAAFSAAFSGAFLGGASVFVHSAVGGVPVCRTTALQRAAFLGTILGVGAAVRA